MKIFKNILCIAALFTIGMVNARAKTTTPSATTKQSAPVPAPAVKKAATPAPAKKKTYQELRNYIVSIKNPKEVFGLMGLQQNFMDKMQQEAQNADIGAVGLEFLLQTARDKHFPLSNNDIENAQRLNIVNDQIAKQVENMNL